MQGIPLDLQYSWSISYPYDTPMKSIPAFTAEM